MHTYKLLMTSSASVVEEDQARYRMDISSRELLEERTSDTAKKSTNTQR